MDLIILHLDVFDIMRVRSADRNAINPEAWLLDNTQILLIIVMFLVIRNGDCPFLVLFYLPQSYLYWYLVIKVTDSSISIVFIY